MNSDNSRPISIHTRQESHRRTGNALPIVLAIFLAAASLLALSEITAAETAISQIEIDDSGVVVEAGDTFTYTIIFSSSVTSTNLAITQSIQSDIQYLNCNFLTPVTGSCSEGPGVLDVTITSPVLPQEHYTFTTHFVANQGLSENIVSAVKMSGLDENSTPLPDTTDVITTTVYVPQPHIVLMLDDGVDVVQPGESISYTLTISNSGDAQADNLAPSFTVPDGVAFISASDGANEAAGQVTWPSFSLASGEVATRTVMVHVQHPLVPLITDIHAVAGATYTGMPASTPSANDVNSIVTATASGLVWHDANGNGIKEPAENGIANAIFELSGLNQPNSAITSNGDGTFEYTGLAWQPYTIKLEEATLPVNMQALFESDQSLDGQILLDLSSGSQTAAADFGFARFAAIQDSFVWADVNADGLFNLEESGIEGITVRLTYAGIDGVFDTADDTPYELITGVDGRFDSSLLFPGKYRLILDEATVPPGYVKGIFPQGSSNGIVLFSLLSGQVATDLNYGFNVLDLSVFKQIQGVEVTTSTLVPYEIIVTNNSPVDAEQVRLTEIIPRNSSFMPSASHPDWHCPDGIEGGASCDLLLGALPRNSSANINFTVLTTNAMPAHVNTLTNTVRIADKRAMAPDPTPQNNQYDLATTVKAEPDLTVRQTDGNTRTEPGDTLRYTIDYSNQGNQDASGVVISMIVPANTRFTAASSSPGWQCADGSLPGVVCLYSVGSVPAGSGGSIDFGMTVNYAMPVNVASINAEVMIRDDSAQQDSDGELTPVDAAPDLILSSSQDKPLAFPGSQIEYTLHYTNAGNRDAIGVLIVETIPENTHFYEAASSTGWDCPDGAEVGKNCIYVVGALPVGASGSVRFAVTVDKDLTPVLGSIDNEAVIAGSGVELDIQNNASSSSIDLQVPTVVDLLSFTAIEQEDETILIEWQTGAERNSWGFLLYRSTDRDWGHSSSMMPSLMPSVGNENSGAVYTFVDAIAIEGITYYYWLHELENGGHTNIYGPIAGRVGDAIDPLQLPNQIFTPMIFR